MNSLRQLAAATADADRFLRFADFAEAFWPIAQPGQRAVRGPYLDALCDELQAAVLDSDYRLRTDFADTVFMTPPRMGKSTTARVLLPAWVWLHQPSTQFLSASNADRLAARDSRKARDVVKSAEYQRLASVVGVTLQIRGDQGEKVEWELTSGGRNECLGVTSVSTGKGADVVLFDDVLDASETLIGSPDVIARRMDEAWIRVDEVLSSRFNPREGGGRGPRISIAQSLDPTDPNHRLAAGGARVVCLPMEYEADHPFAYPQDWRAPGELLEPRLRNAEFCDAERLKRTWSSQHQQRPTPPEGLSLKASWFGERATYTQSPDEIARDAREIVIGVDCAAKTGNSNDWTVYQAWAAHGRHAYLLDERRGRWGSPEQIAEARALMHRWGAFRRPLSMRIEDTSNGIALIQHLRASGVAGVVDVSAGGGAVRTRIAGFAIAAESGDVRVTRAPWVGATVAEWISTRDEAHPPDRTVSASIAVDRICGTSKGRVGALPSIPGFT